MESTLPPRKPRFHYRIQHDMALLAQVRTLKPFEDPRPMQVWGQMAENLRSSRLAMDVTARSCKLRTRGLYERLAQVHGVTEAIVTEWLENPGHLLQKLRQLREPAPTLIKYFMPTPAASKAPQKAPKPCKFVLTPEGDAYEDNSEDCDPLSAEDPAEFADLENSDPLAAFHAGSSSTGDGLRPAASGAPKQNFDKLLYRLLSVEKQMDYIVHWTERQDAMNTEILNQFRILRQTVNRNVVGLPNPCVRMERMEMEEGQWRSSTRSSPRFQQCQTTSKKVGRPRKEPPVPQMTVEDDNFEFELDNEADYLISPNSPPASTDEAPVAVKVEIEEFGSESRQDSANENAFDLEGFVELAAPTPDGDESDPGWAPSVKEKVPSIKETKTKKKKRVRPEGPFVCSICSMQFTQVGNLKQHERNVHKGERPHICPTCGKTFSRLGGLKHHELIHSSERKFKCRFCDLRFNQPQGQNAHERCHLLGSRYGRSQCAQCGQLFVLKYNMENHVRLVHGGARDYACGVCGKAFKTKTHLKYHEGTHGKVGGRQRGLNREKEGGFRIKRVGGVTKYKLVQDSPADAVAGQGK